MFEVEYFKNMENSKIFEVKNMISENMSKIIIEESEKMSGWRDVGFYKARVLEQIEKHPEATETFKNYIKGYIEDSKEILSSTFKKPVKFKMIYVQKWPIGSYAVKHNDTYNYDGTPLFLDCKLATILYMHNDFTGGKLEFPDHDISIDPVQGSSYMFDGGPENEHQVTEITSGDRYTIVTFWDIEGSTYNDYEVESSEKSQQKWLNFIEENRK